MISLPAARALALRHGPFLLLMLVVAPLVLAFTWQDGLATLNDDSTSYLTIAAYLAGGDPIVSQWASLHAHFPPLFPLALALTGGGADLRIAHLVVAACAVLSLVWIYRFAARVLQSERGGLVVVLAFLLTPTAWISLKGILSESMFLLLSFAALQFHAQRCESARTKPRDWLLFGVLLACVYLTRAAGLALVVAYALHAGRRILPGRERPAWPFFLPAVPLALLAGIWRLVRPEAANDAYGKAASDVISLWLHTPGEVLAHSLKLLHEGWLASFHGYTVTATPATLVFTALGLLGVAGALRRAWMNRLDGWYVIVSLGIVGLWAFPEDTIRRLLYPLVPLLLIHAADMARVLCARIGGARNRALILSGIAALPAALCAPAVVLLFQKALDRDPAIVGADYSYADMTDYYRIVSIPLGRELAGKQMAVLAGLGALARMTPPDARIMWMRPEYVAILGKRAAVPFEYSWDPLTLAREVARSKADYIVRASVFKADVKVRPGDPNYTLREIGKYSSPAIAVGNPQNGAPEFILMKVEPAALAAYLAAAG
jgi:hypothetical protein